MDFLDRGPVGGIISVGLGFCVGNMFIEETGGRLTGSTFELYEAGHDEDEDADSVLSQPSSDGDMKCEVA